MGSTRTWVIAVLIAVIAVAVPVFLLFRDDADPCAVLSERDLMDAIADHSTEGGRPLLPAVRLAFEKAELDVDVDEDDLDPVIGGDGNGNVVHVGAHGYWIVLAEVPGGYVTVVRPRPCSILSDMPEQ